MNEKLRRIEKFGGAEKLISEVKERALYFREKIKNLPFRLVSKNPAQAVTALHSERFDAKEILKIMKEKYKIWLCPNGSEMAHSVFRVGHIGAITKEQMDFMIDSLSKTVSELSNSEIQNLTEAKK